MKEYFAGINKIKYEKGSKDPMTFRYYNPSEKIGDKTMEEHLRFAVAYWHTFGHTGADMFGSAVNKRPWFEYPDPLDASLAKADAAFEFMSKLGVKYFCAHDRDLFPELDTLRKTNEGLDKVVSHIKVLMKDTGVKMLWGTANLFSHPRYVHGAASSCNANAFAFAGAQVKKMLEVTKELGGQNYVFWGGREGYDTLLNTDMKLERDNMARFYRMAKDYAKSIGFTGQFLIEPKPKEPTKHQYDFDVSTALEFLRAYDLQDHFKFNIEANHATLATHTFQHELRVARISGKLGSIDANMGDMLLGWDTDQFPTNVYDTTLAMYEVLKNGGIAPGGLNFDAHVRRGSFEEKDLFYAHIAGMDAFALGLRIAKHLTDDKVFENFIEERYSSYNTGIGMKIVSQKVTLKDLEEYVLDMKDVGNVSSRQEMLENILNRYMFKESNA